MVNNFFSYLRGFVFTDQELMSFIKTIGLIYNGGS